MKELIFATNNEHKIREISSYLKDTYKVIGLKDKGIFEEISEDYYTLEENALQKAEFVYDKLGLSCFADDTGLEIDALDGEPGVFSARYSRIGNPVYPEMEVARGNIRKVLENMSGKENRKARFRTVIALIYEHKRYSFEGIVEGTIAFSEKGQEGFGYDPIFVPDNYSTSFAEMTLDQKNAISHRVLALKKLIDFLRSVDHLNASV
jgi:XTP/dITP diphosphohydrolase